MDEFIYQPGPEETDDLRNPSVEEIVEMIDEIIAVPYQLTEEEKTGDEETDEALEQIMVAADRLPDSNMALDALMEAMRPSIREMAPEDRRRFCADMEAKLSPLYGNKTGRFFNGFTSACAPREPGKELGERIMTKRNPHYHPDKP